MSKGYWIKGSEVVDVSASSHVRAIIADPEYFGMTMKEVLSSYRKFGEKLGVENRARLELVTRAIVNGHVRLRHYYKPDHWEVQFKDWEGSKATVLEFMSVLLGKREIYLEDSLLLIGNEDEYLESITVGSLIKMEDEA